MAGSNLKTKTISGMIWSSIQRFGTMIISFVSNIVLARLLTPDDYGTIGMLMIFIAVANTFVDGGFGSALIQKKEPTKEDYSTIFWWNMFLSIVLYGVLYLSAPAIARFYNLPLLSQVLRVQGLVLILNALNVIQQNQLRKQLKFKSLASATVISATLSAGIAIALAYLGWGVWALVAQQLMMSGFTATILWIINKWYPSPIFSKKSFKELFGFGGFILGSNLINTFCNNLQGLLIGKFFPPAMLGYYTQAQKLEQIASTSISNVVDQVSYPILSKFQDDKSQLIIVLKKLASSIAFATFPLMILLIIISEPLIVFLYSAKWLPSVPYFNILCIAGLASSLQGIHYYAVASIGKSKEMFIWTVIKRTLGIGYLIVGVYFWDIYGILWGAVLVSWTVLFINAYLTSKYIGYKLKTQLRDLLPIVALSLFSFFISGVLLKHIGLNATAQALSEGIIFVVIYLLFAHIFKIDAYKQIKNTLFEYVKNIRNK